MDYLKAVNNLNEELYERFGETESTFIYWTNGFVDCIKFGEIWLWNSEDDGRDWLEDKNDYEPFEPFIKRTFNKEVEKLAKLKL